MPKFLVTVSGTIRVTTSFTVEADSAVEAVRHTQRNEDLVDGWRPVDPCPLGECDISAVPLCDDNAAVRELGDGPCGWFTLPEVLRYSELSKGSLYKRILDGRIKQFFIGNQPFYRKADVDALRRERPGRKPKPL